MNQGNKSTPKLFIFELVKVTWDKPKVTYTSNQAYYDYKQALKGRGK